MEEKTMEELEAEEAKLDRQLLERSIFLKREDLEKGKKLEEEEKRNAILEEGIEKGREQAISELEASSVIKNPDTLEKPAHEMATFYAEIAKAKKVEGLTYEEQCKKLVRNAMLRG